MNDVRLNSKVSVVVAMPSRLIPWVAIVFAPVEIDYSRAFLFRTREKVMSYTWRSTPHGPTTVAQSGSTAHYPAVGWTE